MTPFVGLDVSQKMTAICVVDNAGDRLCGTLTPLILVRIHVHQPGGRDSGMIFSRLGENPRQSRGLRRRILWSVIFSISALAAWGTRPRLARGEGRPDAFTPGPLFGPEFAVEAGGEFVLDPA